MGLLGLLASAALSAAALAGCGAAQSITPKRVVFEPTIVACSGNPPDCASGGKSLARRVREARTHRCPRDESILLAKSDGTFVCVARVPTAGPPLIGAAPPRSVRAGGTKAVAEFT